MLVLFLAAVHKLPVDIDCETYNFSSKETSCTPVDICCDSNICWVLPDIYNPANYRTIDPDTVLDLTCSWYTGPVFYDAWFMLDTILP